MNSQNRILLASITAALLMGCASEEKKHNEDSIQIPEPVTKREKLSSKSKELILAEREHDTAIAFLTRVYDIAHEEIDDLNEEIVEIVSDMTELNPLVKPYYVAKEQLSTLSEGTAEYARVRDDCLKKKEECLDAFRDLIDLTQDAQKNQVRLADIELSLVRAHLSCSRKQGALATAFQNDLAAFEKASEHLKDRTYQVRGRPLNVYNLRVRSIRLCADQQFRHSEMSKLTAAVHLKLAKKKKKTVAGFENQEKALKRILEE